MTDYWSQFLPGKDKIKCAKDHVRDWPDVAIQLALEAEQSAARSIFVAANVDWNQAASAAALFRWLEGLGVEISELPADPAELQKLAGMKINAYTPIQEAEADAAIRRAETLLAKAEELLIKAAPEDEAGGAYG